MKIIGKIDIDDVIDLLVQLILKDYASKIKCIIDIYISHIGKIGI